MRIQDPFVHFFKTHTVSTTAVYVGKNDYSVAFQYPLTLSFILHLQSTTYSQHIFQMLKHISLLKDQTRLTAISAYLLFNAAFSEYIPCKCFFSFFFFFGIMKPRFIVAYIKLKCMHIVHFYKGIIATNSHRYMHDRNDKCYNKIVS